MSDLAPLRDAALPQVQAATSIADLEAIRVATLGKKGSITALMKNLATLPPDEQKAYGQAVNELKAAVSEALEVRRVELQAAELDQRLARERVDVSQPAWPATRDACTRSARPSTRWQPFSARWDSRWSRVPRSRTTGITSPRSICRPTIRLGKCRTRST